MDDSELIRIALRHALEGAGFEVEEAAHAHDALRWAESVAFDLIVTDVNMPGIDGLTMIKRLRQLPSYTSTPVFVLTTECTPDMRARGKEVGATAWMVKPMDAARLVQGARRVLGVTA